MEMQTFTAVIHREEDLFVAECPEVGTVSQGRTIEDALMNLKEATELYLEEFPLEGQAREVLCHHLRGSRHCLNSEKRLWRGSGQDTLQQVRVPGLGTIGKSVRLSKK